MVEHNYITNTVEPTCEDFGYIETVCTVCGESDTEYIPPKGHTLEDEWTYVDSGTRDCTYYIAEVKYCTICGEVAEEMRTTYEQHTSSNWIIDKAASIGVKGSKHRECTVCKEVLETAEIPALAKTSISSASVTLSTSTYVYDGKAKTPSVIVKIGGKTLKKDTAYTVSYSNNTKVGTAKVTITGKGNYTGTITKTYSIKNDFTKASVSGISTKAFTGKAQTQKITVKFNGKTLKGGTDYTVSYSNNTKVGTATIKIVGKGSYTGTIIKTFSIKNNFTKSTVSGIATKTFTGKAQTQKITVKFNGKTLKNGTDYTVSYSNNTKVGTATVKIVGKGSYTGTITKTFKINPAKQTINKLSAKSKGFTASWSKKDHATGYEIQYSTDSKFKSVSKSTITNKTTTSKTFTKLKANKKYYVRMRIYTTVKGTKYYGAWSATKTVTTKK